MSDIREIQEQLSEHQAILEQHGGKLSDHELRLGHAERNYQELRRDQKHLNDAQIRLEAYVEMGFKRSEEQNNQIIGALSDLSKRQESAEKANQERHTEIIQMVTKGDEENSKETAEGDRRNFEAIAERKWDAKTTWLTVLIGAIAIGVTLLVWLKP